MQASKHQQSLNALGESELEEARHDARAATDDERRLAHALRIAGGAEAENDFDGAVELARSYPAEQLDAWLAEAKAQRSALGEHARKLAAAPPTRAIARASSLPRVTRREKRSRTTATRDDGGGDDVPSGTPDVGVQTAGGAL